MHRIKTIQPVLSAGPRSTVLYLFYRAGRNLVERRQVLLFADGLVCIHGLNIAVYPWNKIAEISQQEIGDAIDEQAVVIHLKYGLPPLRFTSCHFHNLDKFWQRLQREFRQSKVGSLVVEPAS